MKALGKRSIATFLRGWLTVLWWLGWVAATIVVVAIAAALITGNQTSGLVDVPVEFDLDPAAYQISTKQVAVSGATITDAAGMLRFESVNRPAMAVYLVIALVYAGVMLFVIHQLRMVFRSLADGDPFSLANASRIRLIGLFFIFGEIAVSVLVYVCQLYVKSALDSSGLTINPGLDIELSPIFGGLVLLVIAEVFRSGTRLQQDQDLTV
jgi:hypothetical protein